MSFFLRCCGGCFPGKSTEESEKRKNDAINAELPQPVAYNPAEIKDENLNAVNENPIFSHMLASDLGSSNNDNALPLGPPVNGVVKYRYRRKSRDMS